MILVLVLCLEGWRRVLKGWGGRLVGLVVGRGVSSLLSSSALASMGEAKSSHVGFDHSGVVVMWLLWWRGV